jgi:hypothetical protein
VSLCERRERGNGGGGGRGSGERRNDRRERERESGKWEIKGLGLGLWVWGFLGGLLGWERGVWLVGIHGERDGEVCFVLSSFASVRSGFGWWRRCGLSD